MKNLYPAIVIAVSMLVLIFVDLASGIAAFIILAALFYFTKNIEKKVLPLMLVLFLIFSLFFVLNYVPAASISSGYGTVLSDNWWQALNWIKDNTADCAVVATYWDPGHFITGIARRPVVFDGASQSHLYTRPTTEDRHGLVVDTYDHNINHIVLYENGNKTTARIQDISTTLLTSNETLALDILKEYKNPGCDEMYYIASADLIPKSTWWTYFSTWNPVDKKGTPYVYSTIPLGSSRPDIQQNAIIYTYPVSQEASFVVYLTENNMVVFLQQQGAPAPLKVEKFLFFDNDGTGRLVYQQNASIPGLVFIQPGNSALMFIPPELENAMFTRMFLFNGQGLDNFEYVNEWGGEVKLFRVKFNDTG